MATDGEQNSYVHTHTYTAQVGLLKRFCLRETAVIVICCRRRTVLTNQYDASHSKHVVHVCNNLRYHTYLMRSTLVNHRMPIVMYDHDDG